MKQKQECSYCDQKKLLVKYLGDSMCSECRDGVKETQKLMSAHLKEVKKVYGKTFNIDRVDDALHYIIAGGGKNGLKSALGKNVVTTTYRNGVYGHTHKHIK